MKSSLMTLNENMKQSLLEWVVAHQTKPVDDYDYKVYNIQQDLRSILM